MDKVFAITRNVVDVIPSLFLLMNFGSHSMTAEQNIAEAFPAEWDAWIKVYVTLFKDYHNFLLRKIA